MATKRYRLTNACHVAHGSKPTFSFRIGYEKVEGSSRRYVSQKNAPIITVGPGEVIRTDNVHAQQCIEHFHVPHKTQRNGVRRADPASPTFVFEAVAGPVDPTDTNLDAILV